MTNPADRTLLYNRAFGDISELLNWTVSRYGADDTNEWQNPWIYTVNQSNGEIGVRLYQAESVQDVPVVKELETPTIDPLPAVMGNTPTSSRTESTQDHLSVGLVDPAISSAWNNSERSRLQLQNTCQRLLAADLPIDKLATLVQDLSMEFASQVSQSSIRRGVFTLSYLKEICPSYIDNELEKVEQQLELNVVTVYALAQLRYQQALRTFAATLLDYNIENMSKPPLLATENDWNKYGKRRVVLGGRIQAMEGASTGSLRDIRQKLEKAQEELDETMSNLPRLFPPGCSMLAAISQQIADMQTENWSDRDHYRSVFAKVLSPLKRQDEVADLKGLLSGQAHPTTILVSIDRKKIQGKAVENTHLWATRKGQTWWDEFESACQGAQGTLVAINTQSAPSSPTSSASSKSSSSPVPGFLQVQPRGHASATPQSSTASLLSPGRRLRQFFTRSRSSGSGGEPASS
ncbi:hypothetical protein M231_05733 [Tremella mesenterica]|uniref:Uncharacterized protein n=1 Tax=Tremella mesenterica TaxID=5217 RepID=A0A4Q1BH97_TREME|nr:hypothetical protein M231_05733 [Tremella mesenterica]